MSGIEKVINIFGAVLIIGGILIGGGLFFNVDRESYKDAQESASGLYADALEKMELQAAASVYYAELTFAVSILLVGLIVGLFFMGFAKLIENSEDNGYETNRRLQGLSDTIRKLDNTQ